MTISSIASNLLARAGLHADAPITEIAKIAKLQVHTARYHLARLQDQGVISPTLVVDTYSLGWQRVQVLLSLASPRPENRKRFIAALIAHPNVGFLAETAGDYDLEMVLLVRGLDEVGRVLQEAGCEQSVRVVGKGVAAHQVVSLFPRKYLAPQWTVRESLTVQAGGPAIAIDSMDHNLLCEMSVTPLAPQQELARKLGVSAVTINHRLKKLRQSKVIRGVIWSVHGHKVGSQNFIFLLETHGFDSKLGDQIFEYAKKHPCCTNYRHTLGNWDFEIGAEVPETAEVVKMKDEISERFFDRVSRIHVLNRIAILKYRVYPFTRKKS